VIADARTWLPILKWLHMLGFRGHFSTKSRRYSVTMGRLRADRRTWRQRHDPSRELGLNDGLESEYDSTLVVIRGWMFDGVGWLTSGDATLAASAAARARAQSQSAPSSTPPAAWRRTVPRARQAVAVEATGPNKRGWSRSTPGHRLPPRPRP
jgi:hypothetical protein